MIEIIPRWINIGNAISIQEPDGQLETKLSNFAPKLFLSGMYQIGVFSIVLHNKIDL